VSRRTSRKGRGDKVASSIPACAWCGRYRSAINSVYCALCCEHEAAIDRLLERSLPRR
jgi:hypothetical protein